MNPLDIAALIVFAVGWLLYQPLLKRLSRRGSVINTDMTVVRRRWMANMAARENRFLDSQLMGHALNSASFFASANLIVIAAAAGALFRSDTTYRTVAHMVATETGPRWLFEAKLALVVLALARGLLDFIWAIRQMNYTLAAIGAAPPTATPPAVLKAYGEAAAEVLNPALSSFNNGVRGYYFALAAAAWMLGPWAMIAAVLLAVGLLYTRQVGSSAARGVRQIRQILDDL
ncbi:MAG: hypothetical protein JWO72_2621 [Caulobacteraceae bacterium]|jgi:uncharacterized membrane protein|nr:hypothetical protein [Caulobacteraceae bacterium]